MVAFLSFPAFVCLPVGECGANIVLLALFRAATQDYHQIFAVLAEINPVTGAEKINKKTGANYVTKGVSNISYTFG